MNGFGIFLWKDGRSYKGEYKDDKKHNFGIYYGNESKKYEGFWEDGSQKNLGKHTKKDGSFKLGYWNESQIQNHITDDKDVAKKLKEIDLLIEETINKVNVVMSNISDLFAEYLPNVSLESLLEFR